jgi:uncharacterized protein YfaS (alpha-2-macroglobulin family)
MRLRLPLLALLLLTIFAGGLAVPLPAAAFDLPGLSGDAAGYADTLRRRNPAGGTQAQRNQAQARIDQAQRQNNMTALVEALEARIAAGDPTPDHWLSLARAQVARTPPDLPHALQAAWNNFAMVPAGADEIPALLVIVQALQAQNRLAEALSAMEEVVQRAPRDATLRQQLADLRRTAGMLVRRVSVEPEAEPASACISFTAPPLRDTSWQPADWLRADPAIPGLAVTRNGDSICAAGLPHGRATRLVLRAGLPGQGGNNLKAETPVTVAMPDRAPRILFDSRAFILPRGQAPRVTVATVNLPALKLRLLRVSERSLVALRENITLGREIESYQAETLQENTGRLVWEGTATLARSEPNRITRSALPLPEALRSAGPGLYALIASPTEPGRGGDSVSAVLPIFATDLAITAWRGSDGIAAQLRGLQDARIRPGVKVALVARNNEVLAEAETDAAGLVRFGAPLLRGTGPIAAVALHAQAGDDLVTMDLEAAAFDLSDRGATGLPHPGPLDAFLWTERGIYRPGETIHAAALLRDAGGSPADFPARLRLKRPNGQVFAELVPPRQAGGSVLADFTLSAAAQAGAWTLEVLSDPQAPPIGSATIRVEAFVAERLEVKAGPVTAALPAGQVTEIPVTARFLYGAPAAGLSGSAEIRLLVDPAPFTPIEGGESPWKGWYFGVAGENFAPDLLTPDIAETDADGRGTLPVDLSAVPDSTRPLALEATVSINEPGGRASRASLTAPIRGQGDYVAIRPAFADGAIDAGGEAAFDLAAVAPDGSAVAKRLSYRLVRERPQWRIVMRGSLARYETVWLDEPVDAGDLAAAPKQPAHYARRLPFGRYRLEASDGKLGLATYRFRAGWVGTDSAEVPDKVDVSADQRSYAPGASARIRIAPPFAGRASLAVLTDRLVATQEVDVPEGGTEVTLPVDAAWGPGAYVAVTVFRPGEVKEGSPARALGLAWLGLDPAARSLQVEIGTPDMVRPRQRIEVPVRLANAGGAAHLTLAAVDEGILRLTNFRTPDPGRHFLGRRRLGVDIRDDYGRLIAPAEGDLAALRQGGDGEMGEAAIDIPQRTVALFSGLVAVAPDGSATVPLDIPDFAGELRLMVVAWDGTRIGAAGKPLTVRDPVVAEALLPRFLAPGDEARLPVLLHNIDLPAGQVTATLAAEGAVAITGPTSLAETLAQGARAVPATQLTARGAGQGLVRLTVTGPNGFTATRESRITVRSSRPLATEIVSVELAPGATAPLNPPADRFVPGTWRAAAVWGGAVRYDPAAVLRELEDFPLACTEQSSSRVMALAMASDALAGKDRPARLQAAVNWVLDRQRYDGAFGLWSAQGEGEAWLSAYAVEALWRAKQAGATVPEAALANALRSLADMAEESPDDEPAVLAAQAYRLHVLALAGTPRPGAARRLFLQLDKLPTPLARAQLAAAFARMGDNERAEAAFQAALSAPGRRYWHDDYGTATRDNLALAVLLKEANLLPDRLANLITRLPGADLRPALLSTQEQAWAVAAAAVLGRDARPVRVSLDGTALEPGPLVSAALDKPASARNAGDRPVYQTMSITGLPAQPLPAARDGFRIARRFFALDGQPVNLDQLKQNTVFLLQLELRSETAERHRAMIQQGLPAGWEIVGRLPAGAQAGMDFLGELSEAAAQPALDDRIAIAADLSPANNTVRYAFRIRAVTPGRFELPGAEAKDMYRPGIFARQNTGRILVLGD